jgi:hypothetical protein
LCLLFFDLFFFPFAENIAAAEQSTTYSLEQLVASSSPEQLPTQLGLPRTNSAGCSSTCRPSDKLEINNGRGQIIEGVRIRGALGACIVIADGSTEIVIRNSELIDCGGPGIDIMASQGVRIESVRIVNTTGPAVALSDVQNAEVRDSYFERNASALYAHQSSGVQFKRNFVRNVKGPFPRGQMVQFDKVVGAGNSVLCNVVVNEPGLSAPEDAINMFRTNGTPESPVQISFNKIIGGGPSESGGGILAGDYGGKHITISDNVLIDPGQYGIAIAGGEHITIIRNRVLAKRQSFNNVGLYVWRVAPEGGPCADHTVRDNEISYINGSGKWNPNWNARNCGLVRDYAHNTWYASRLSVNMAFDVFPACRTDD